MRTSSLAEPAKKAALHGLFLCLALIFSYLEAQLPLLLLPIPGFKLGFANLVITLCAYLCGFRSACLISIARVFLTAFLFGGWSAFWFSLCGALCSLITLGLLLRFARRFLSPLGVSVACAASHNIGQLFAAMLLMKSTVIAVYLPALLWMGMLTGTITGILVTLLLYAYPKSFITKSWKGSQ